MGDFSEYVSETGRDLGGRGIPVPGTLVEQARTGAAEPIWLFPVTMSASGYYLSHQIIGFEVKNVTENRPCHILFFYTSSSFSVIAPDGPASLLSTSSFRMDTQPSMPKTELSSEMW